MSTKLVLTQRLTNGAGDVKFTRQDGNKYFTIYAEWDKCKNSWQQWGAPVGVLQENTEAVQDYFHNRHKVDFKGLFRAQRSYF